MTGKYSYKIADPAELPRLLKFRATVYVSEFGAKPDDAHDQAATHIAAYEHDAYGCREIVATFRILSDSQRPFEFESLYPLGELVATGHRPAMIGRLCVHPAHRNVSRSMGLLRGLLELAQAHAEEEGITEYFMYALEPLVKFYGRAGFREVGITLSHRTWGPLRLMRMFIGHQRHHGRSTK